MKIEDYEPAFPHRGIKRVVDEKKSGYLSISYKEIEHQLSGLTKREYFASMAMQGFISAGSQGMPTKDKIVNYAVEAADALIEELSRELHKR